MTDLCSKCGAHLSVSLALLSLLRSRYAQPTTQQTKLRPRQKKPLSKRPIAGCSSG